MGLNEFDEREGGTVPHRVLLIPRHINRGYAGELGGEQRLQAARERISRVEEVVELLNGWARRGGGGRGGAGRGRGAGGRGRRGRVA